MPSFITVAATAVAVLILSYVYAFAKNTFDARNTGFPSIYLPIAQDNIVWMLTSVPLRHFLRANLPARIFNRLNLSIYGWEFHHRFLPYEAFCGSQADLKTFMLVTCGRLELWTSNAEIVAQVLGRPKDFMQLDLSNWIMGIFGNNILTSDGDHWARQRKVIATVINERVSKAVFNESVLQAEGLLAELTSRQGDSETIKTNQLFNMAKKVAINVLSGAGMGNQVPWEDKADEQPKAGFRQTYIQSTRAVINCVGGPIILPQWFLKAYPPFLPGKAFLKNLSIAKTEFPVHTKDLLEKERVRSSAEGNSTQNNILSQLLRASEKPAGENPKGGSKAALSEEELVANMFIFTAAGFDTTANTISYAIVLLARYPEWQNWLLEEMDEVLPDDPNEELDYVSVYPKIIRLQAFLYEVLRHFTPLVHVSKQARTPQTFQTSVGNFWIPGKTTIYINAIALHAEPSLWRGLNASPNEKLAIEDEWSFRPTRWINPPGSAQPFFQPPKGAYIAWSMGPRICPGQKMAQVEFVAIFLTIFRNRRIDAVPLENESRSQTEERLDKQMRNSISILTLIMEDVFDVEPDSGKGLHLALTKR